ncbi:MAG: ferrochelatase [Oligoflexales bacterium]|nr:ferrochelatase [Oligoflexales bacterium]
MKNLYLYILIPFFLYNQILFGKAPMHKIGILLASHGDIDSLSELKPYLEKGITHMAPLPGNISGLVSRIGWPLFRAIYEPMYKSFGVKTYYRENTLKQVKALQRQLDANGTDAKVYMGFNLLSPTVTEALDEMKADGVEIIVLINQGAQYSMATRMNYMDVIDYLKNHSDYQPKVIGINQYTQDERFRALLVDSLKEDLSNYFPEGSSNNTCLLMTFHGIPATNVRKGDKSTQDMLNLFEYVRSQFPEYKMYYGFLNENIIPFVKWTGPTAVESARKVGEARAACSNVLMDARISFTVHPRIVLYDVNVLARKEILNRNPSAMVVLAQNFNDNEKLARFFADMAEEALNGRGDLSYLDMTSTIGHH